MDLTIAIPSYKRPSLLALALERLFKHPWQREVRYLVLVNQPDQGYAEALAPFMADSRLRVQYQASHRSIWQQCCALGNEVDTEYILHVSDDDDIDPAAVEIYLQVMEQSDQVLGAFAPVSFVDAEGREAFVYNPVSEITLVQRGDFAGLLDLLAANEHWPELGLFRTAAIRRINAHLDHINSAMLQLGQLLARGCVLFGQLPFYRLHFRQFEAEHHIGTRLVSDLSYLESSLFGLDLLLQMAREQQGSGITAERELALLRRHRAVYGTRLREHFHAVFNRHQHAEALAMRRRLDAYDLDVGPGKQPSPEIAALELAYGLLEAMSWLDYLVVYQIAPLVEYAHRTERKRCVAADTPDACASYRDKALFLCFERERAALEKVVPAKRIRSFEDLTAPFKG